MTPVAVGVDYSTRALDVAVLNGRELIGPVEHRLGRDAKAVAAVITRVSMDLHRLHGPVVMWMERPWVHRSTGKDGETHYNFQNVIDLCLLVGSIRGIFLASGHAVELVAPDAWRAAVMLKPTGRDRASKKAAAIRTVQLEYGRTVSDNQADAILLAVYGKTMARREALVGR